MPEVIPGYNKGLSDFHAEHNWVLSAIWQIPTGFDRGGVAGALLNDWQVATHRADAQRQPAHRVRADQPIAVAVGAVARARAPDPIARATRPAADPTTR